MKWSFAKWGSSEEGAADWPRRPPSPQGLFSSGAEILTQPALGMASPPLSRFYNWLWSSM